MGVLFLQNHPHINPLSHLSIMRYLNISIHIYSNRMTRYKSKYCILKKKHNIIQMSRTFQRKTKSTSLKVHILIIMMIQKCLMIMVMKMKIFKHKIMTNTSYKQTVTRPHLLIHLKAPLKIQKNIRLMKSIKSNKMQKQIR